LVYIDQDAKNAGEVIAICHAKCAASGVQVEMTDKFRSMAKPGGGTSQHGEQTPPIQTRTSGGWP